MNEFEFKRKANRFVVWLKSGEMVVLADSRDGQPVFLTAPPSRYGDMAIVSVEGQAREVTLETSRGKNKILVDRGPAGRMKGMT